MNLPGLVVVGGGPAALETARAYRVAGGAGAVTLLSADRHPPYNRPPLSKDHLRGESGTHELPLEDDSFYAAQGIDLRLGVRVAALRPDDRAVVLDDGSTLAYDVCVLATGASPTPLPVEGADHPDVLYLRSRVDGEVLRARAETERSAVVVGSGFIGCEAAASLAARGLDVVMVSHEEVPQAGRLGDEAGARIAGWLTEAGVQVVGGVDVSRVEDGRRVVLADGTSYDGGLVLLATGVTPHGELAEAAGLDCEDGRVLVDAAMRTSRDGVLAAGDVALAHNGTAGRRLVVEHWGEALRMGEIAGTTAAGGDDSWSEAPGFWSEIGTRTLKYSAWGDGHDSTRFVDHEGGGFTVWYGRAGTTVGVLTHDADDDYERGQHLVEQGATF